MVDKAALSCWIVDDDDLVVDILSHMVADLGCGQIRTFLHGASVVDALLDKMTILPELIFLDINLPDVDGIKLIRDLAESGYEGGLIFISGEDLLILQTTEKLALLRKLNVFGSLQKPISRSKLKYIIDNFRHLMLADTFHRKQKQFKIYSCEEIEQAIERQEFVNFYQPKVKVETGEVVGVETLIRWQHPVDGLVYPDSFILNAEKCGVIGKITEIVIEQSVKQAKEWLDIGMPLRVAINISMDDLSNVDFTDFFLATLQKHQLPNKWITLEITESKLMENLIVALDVVARLQLNRIKLSVDDFGTGHSSLTQVKDLPFNQLKIDRAFTSGAHDNSRLRAIFDSSNMLAKLLHMEVVAEGVEDINDWHYLQNKKTDLAQGYFIGKPMPSESLPNWMQTWHERVKDEALAS